MTTQLPTVEQVSEAFRKQMQATLTADELGVADRINRLRGENGSCATHDFCDANEVMDEALQSLGVHIYPDDVPDDWNGPKQEVVDLWNAAWTHVRRRGFSLT